MSKRLICDPPTGWAYGFPKEMPENLRNGEFIEWLVAEGYPRQLIEKHKPHFHCRFWEMEDNDSE